MAMRETSNTETIPLSRFNGSQGWAVDSVLTIRLSWNLDAYAEKALKATESWIKQEKWNDYVNRSRRELDLTAKDTF
jgi:hypothetical protein